MTCFISDSVFTSEVLLLLVGTLSVSYLEYPFVV